MAIALASAAAACGSSESGGVTTDDVAVTDAPATDPPTTDASEDAALDDVQAAVIRIETTGAYVEPDESLVQTVESVQLGGGTGFIIDPTGIAVTNQHVVTGAATIDVYVEGADEPVSARLLGSSECSDLAVIDLDGDGYTALEWYEGDIEPGLEIFVAGFPLGDEEYTLLDGIVSKARADGETPWASVDWAIEHTAPIQPGNSGGPLVTPAGEVVAVNYAYGQPGTGTSQYYAIARELAMPLVGELQDGGDDFTTGVSGRAVVDETTGVAGVWVSAVDAGSPADEAGVLPGDIIERLEGLPVGTDGTLETYCDVLGSRGPEEVLSLQVLRFADDARLRGSLNGTRLAPVESLAQQVDEAVEVEESETTYEGYAVVTDDTGALEVEVPATWTDLDGDFPFVDDNGERSGVGLRAAPDLNAFEETWATPGMGFSAMTRYEDSDVADLLDLNKELLTFLQSCTAQPVEDYDDGLYTGYSELYTDCGGTSTSHMLIAAEDDVNDLIMFIDVQIATDADLEALDRIIETFRVVGAVDTLDDTSSDDGVDDGGDADYVDDGLAPESYSGYQEVIDSAGVLGVEVPNEWTDIREGPGFNTASDPENPDLFHGVGISASTDVDAWRESWGVPGVSFSATTNWDGDVDRWFNDDYTQFSEGGWFYRTDCAEVGVWPYEDPLYSGIEGLYTDCGGGDTGLWVVVAAPPDKEYVIVLAATQVTDADAEALDRIVSTFQVLGEVPS